jgi:AcrR family transcriptional regulator
MLAADVAAHQSARVHRAMIEIVAARGFQAVKVRDLVEIAGVSTRAFYERFESKEDCFLRTYDEVMGPAIRRLLAAQAGEGDWRRRPRLILDAFVQELASAPDAARLALIEAHAAGPAALAHARRTEATFTGMVAESFARAPQGMPVPPLIVEGMTEGVAEVVRTRLLAGRGAQLVDLSDELTDWVLVYPGKQADALAALDLESVWRDTRLSPDLASVGGRGDALDATGDRALILTVVAKLATTTPYAELTPSAIRRGASVSRKVFGTHFEGVEDSFLAAVEWRIEEILAQVARAQAAAKSAPGGLYRGVSALCDEVASDPLVAGICLADPFPSGSRGSRARTRLVAAIGDQLVEGASTARSPSPLAAEASRAATWALFHHHVVRAPSHSSPQIAATLAFVALAPAIGAAKTIAAIRSEQSG